jgi:hypothetical protein
MKILKWLLITVIAQVFFGACAITDYDGYLDHKTQGEAKLWGTEIAFSGFGPDDGTYAYTVKYDNTDGLGPVTITGYRNPVFAAFSREGFIDREGDDVQGNRGSLTAPEATPAGRFKPFVRSIDTGRGTCEFFDNVVFDKSKAADGTAVALCEGGPVEEIDSDLDLQASFASLDDLLGRIWSGALSGWFDMNMTHLVIDGAKYEIDGGFALVARAAPLRPVGWVVDRAFADGLIDTILNYTDHGQGHEVGFVFEGGMTFDMPAGMLVAFNHDFFAAL